MKRFWRFLKQDSWQSWLVSLVLTFIFIKFLFFPVLSFAFDTRLPLVVVESCSMYHADDFDAWWEQNALWYESKGIVRANFDKFPFRNGLNKGDIIIVSGKKEYGKGDIIVFQSIFRYPLIHRIIDEKLIATKGDNNVGQLPEEQSISKDAIVGRAIGRIPGLGWLKLIFFEGLKPREQRGFCR